MSRGQRSVAWVAVVVAVMRWVRHVAGICTPEIWDGIRRVNVAAYVAPVVGEVAARNRSSTMYCAVSAPVTVMRPDAAPPAAFYAAQTIKPGYGYMKTRDGTTLSVDVKLPGPPDAGPYPTVVEYSGYDPSNPNAPQPSELLAQLLGLDHLKTTFLNNGRSERPTVVYGKVIKELLA